MVQGIPIRFFAVPTFMGWLVEHGLTQLAREGGLVCRERWKLDQVPLPPEVLALEPVDHAWAALDWATLNMGSLDAELRFDATRIVYGLEWLRGASDQTILTARHLSEMGGRMVPLLAYKLSSEDRPTRKLAAAALGVLGPDIEPCLPEIVAAMRERPEVLAHVRARYAASSGLLRTRLAESLDEDC